MQLASSSLSSQLTMEVLQLPFILPSFLCIILSVLLIKILYKPRPAHKAEGPQRVLPPGPRNFPIIGSMHHLIGSPPHRALRDLSNKFGPVMHLKLGEVDHVIISSPEAAKAVMTTNHLSFASRPELLSVMIIGYGTTDIAFSPHGEYWKQLRKICATDMLSPKQVKNFSSLRGEETRSLVERISSSSGAVNLTEMFVALSNTITHRATYGDRCPHQERFISAIRESTSLASGFIVADLYPSKKFLGVLTGVKCRMSRLHRRIDGILDDIIAEQQQKYSHDDDDQQQGGDQKESCLLDVLLRIKDRGDLEIPLTMDNIKAVILDIFAGGTETTGLLMDWVMAELMRNPKVMQKVQAEVREALKGKSNIEEEHCIEELTYLKMVIKETLRLHPLVPLLLPRTCTETCEVAGYTILQGSKIIINGWGLGRDPKYWEDAESFKPERFDEKLNLKFMNMGDSFEYLPFGAGRRICPGRTFAMAIVENALAQLLFHFDWELPEGMRPQDLDMTELFGATAFRKSQLVLLARPYVVA